MAQIYDIADLSTSFRAVFVQHDSISAHGVTSAVGRAARSAPYGPPSLQPTDLKILQAQISHARRPHSMVTLHES
ncbi:hypothetical protein VTN02DRAFT_2293 [Thermoascus thermophilus]